jgi:hypothetical protein
LYEFRMSRTDIVVMADVGHELSTRSTEPGRAGTYADGLAELVEPDAEAVGLLVVEAVGALLAGEDVA